MRDAKAGFGELKALWQTATRVREQRQPFAHEAAPPGAARSSAAPISRPASALRATTRASSAPEDTQLFRRAMQSVTPLASTRPTAVSLSRCTTAVPAPSAEQLAKRQAALGLDFGLACPKPSAAAATLLSDHYVPNHLSTDLGLAWHAPDTAADAPRRLQRGHWPVTACLDLHGLRVDAARNALTAFLADCVLHRVRCVRIIHGKGHGSTHASPVLRDKVPAWLVQHPDVCAFVQAPPREGGAGALLVLLRGASDANRPDKAR